jgi:hypothetical protein
MVSVPARREQVTYATRRGLSQRRACTLMKVARSALGYRSTKAVRDVPVLARMVALSAQYPRYGYRRIRVFLGRDGHAMTEYGVSAVAPRPAAIAPQTTAEADRDRPPTPASAERREPGVGV